MKLPLSVLIGGALTLTACASTAERRIENSLIDAGLPRGLSSCMANRLSENLSVTQLRRVADFADGFEGRVEDMTIGEIGRKFRPLGDAALITTIGRAAAGCAISG